MKKQSKEELKKKNQLIDCESQCAKGIFQLLIESSGDMISIHDREGRYTNYYGPSKYSLSKEDLMGKTPADLFDKVESEKITSNIKEVFKTGKSKEFVAHLDWEGKRKIFSEKVYPLFKNKKVVEVVKICKDITERIVTEAALKRSEERHELSLTATNDGIYDWNMVTNEIYYSPRWKSMLGYKDHELPNDFSVWEKLTLPEDVKKSWKMQDEMIRKKREKFQLEFKMKHKEGHWVDILSRATCFFDEKGIANRIVGTHIDVTYRVQKETELSKYREDLEKLIKERTEKLEESGRYTRGLIEVNLDALVTISNKGKITDVNLATEIITGVEREKLIGDNFSNYFTDPKAANKGYEKVFSDGIVKDYPLTIKHKDGSTTHVLYNASVYKDKDGNIEGVFAAARDISNQLSLEKKVTDRTEELEEKNKELDNTLLIFIGREQKIQRLENRIKLLQDKK